MVAGPPYRLPQALTSVLQTTQTRPARDLAAPGGAQDGLHLSPLLFVHKFGIPQSHKRPSSGWRSRDYIMHPEPEPESEPPRWPWGWRRHYIITPNPAPALTLLPLPAHRTSPSPLHTRNPHSHPRCPHPPAPSTAELGRYFYAQNLRSAYTSPHSSAPRRVPSPRNATETQSPVGGRQ